MNSRVSCIVMVALFGSACAQYGGQYNGGYNGNYDQGSQNGHNSHYTQPKVAILNHKQALGTDGSFNYAFNADNGIQQGESINPDGTRQGSYSYVDPNGKTVSLKYIAGRDGFKVLEGDHVPRSVPLPAHHVAAYQAAAAAHVDAAHKAGAGAGAGAGAYSAPYRQSYNVDESDDHGNYQNYRSSSDDGSYRSGASDEGNYNSASEAIHSGPHSFGNGFSFEFAGNRY